MGHDMAIAYNPLPVALVAWPLLCALLVTPLGRRSERVRDGFVVFATAVTLLGAAALVPAVASEHLIGARVPLMVGEITFAVDSFGMLFALTTTFVWFAATLYSTEYLKHEHKRDRFHTASMVVLSAMLGTVLAGDLVTLYLFFEVLGLTAFLLVVHTETTEAKPAAVKYLWMTVLGGFALMGGIFLTYAIGGHGALVPLPLGLHPDTLTWVTFGLLVVGFGVKAGMLPVHVWLPDAHPVAPTPASALLSGIMIKAGAYGIFRTATALFRPPVAEHVEEALWHASGTFGLVILWLGIATMAIGVIMALGQSNAKRMLAYHSVSQMGFILAGIGAAAYLGEHGALGIAGGLYHVVNHALFKGALFLGVGAVAFRTGELDMYKLGGLWRKMPMTFLFTLIAAAGITGVPLLNGFVSKCLIHHALVEAFEYEHLVSLGIAEKIYVVTCGGTACSFIKLIGFVFLGKAKRDYGPDVVDAPVKMLAPLAMLSAAIVALGLWPQLLLDGVFAPGLHTWGLHSEALDHYLAESFLSVPDIMSAVTAFAIGAVIFVVGMRFELFHLHAPAWFGVNFWYMAAARGFVSGCGLVQQAYEGYLRWLPRVLEPAYLAVIGGVSTAYEESVALLSRGGRRAFAFLRSSWLHMSRRWKQLGAGLATSGPEVRNERFLRRAACMLAAEQQECVRTAVDTAHGWLAEQPNALQGMREPLISVVRDTAGSIAENVNRHRLEILSEAALAGELDQVRGGFEAVLAQARVLNERIAEVSVDLSRRLLAGENVSIELDAAQAGAVREERFAHELREAAVPERRLTFADWRAMGLGGAELAAGWVTDIMRILAEASTQEHAEWYSPRVDAATVIAMRQRIQRYARDMSANVAVILVVLLVFIVSLVANS